MIKKDKMKKPTFKIQTKKGQAVYRVDIGIRSNADMHKSTWTDAHGIKVKEYKIVHQTDRKIVLSDSYVTLLDRIQDGQKKETYHFCLEQGMVVIKTKETFFANGIFAYIYTVESPEKAIVKLRSAIKKKIATEYSFLFDINVDDIIDGFSIQTNLNEP